MQSQRKKKFFLTFLQCVWYYVRDFQNRRVSTSQIQNLSLVTVGKCNLKLSAS